MHGAHSRKQTFGRGKHLEGQIRSKTASIVLYITHDGQAQVKDLLVNGQS